MTINFTTTAHSSRSLLSLIKLYHRNYLYLTVRVKASALPVVRILQDYNFIYSFTILPYPKLTKKSPKVGHILVLITFKKWHELDALHIIDIFPRQVSPMRHKVCMNWWRRQRNKSAQILLINTSKGVLTHLDAIRLQLGGFPIAVLT